MSYAAIILSVYFPSIWHFDFLSFSFGSRFYSHSPRRAPEEHIDLFAGSTKNWMLLLEWPQFTKKPRPTRLLTPDPTASPPPIGK